MSYKGSINRIIGFGAKIKEKLPTIKARITLIENAPNAKIKPISQYNATIKRSVSFAGVIKKLNLIFRFLKAKARIIQTHKAKAISAPAVDVQVNSTIQASKEAPLDSSPATDMTVNKKERLSVYAKLSAYRRAGCVYMKKLFFRRKAELKAAPGAVASYSEIFTLKRTAKAAAAESAIIESKTNKIKNGHEAAGASAPAQTVPAVEMTLTAKHTATASKGTAVVVGINELFRAVHRAPLASWFFPEQDGNTLQFFQVFSGIQSGNVLEVDLESESAYWANATVTDRALNLVFAETVTKTGNILEVS